MRRLTASEEEAALQKELQDRLFPLAKNPAGKGTKRTPTPRGTSVAAKRAALARSDPLSSREQQKLLDDIAAKEAQAAFKLHSKNTMAQSYYYNDAGELKSLPSSSSSEDEWFDQMVDDDPLDTNVRVVGGTHVPDSLVGLGQTKVKC